MLTELKHGSILNTVSNEEMRALLEEYTTRQETRDRVRAGAGGILDSAGTLTLDVLTVDSGWEFEARRVFLDLGSVTESTLQTAGISLTTVGTSVQYLRSGTRIEWGNPINATSASGRIPGIQTWGSQQGPYLRNGETFSIRLALGAGNAGLAVSALVEGIQSRAGSLK